MFDTPSARRANGVPLDAPPHDATRLMRQLLDESNKFTAYMEGELTVNETDFRAMEVLMENGPMTAGELAKAVGVSPGATTAMIDRLVAVGHVTRQQNATDRRGIIVTPNPASVESAWRLLSPVIRASEERIRAMNPDSQKAVVTYLEAMIQAFGSPSRS